MRQTFDRSIPLLVQRMRVAGAKQVGRKHNHTIGPGKAAELARRKAKAKNTRANTLRRRFSEAVSAFFRGETDQYPERKT